MNSVTAFIACLLILGAQGQPASKSNKCKCYSYIGRISPKLIKAEPVIHYPSIFCPHTEIIVTTKADMKRCVSPESPLGRHILKNQNGGHLNSCLKMYSFMHRSKHSTPGTRRPTENISHKSSCPRITEFTENALFCDIYRYQERYVLYWDMRLWSYHAALQRIIIHVELHTHNTILLQQKQFIIKVTYIP
uniref:C-X-C motif chemokine 10 n=1 Tax=Maylandia zebra TaxID=106582 RepID=A0A3P9B743_9CICH